MKKAVAFYLCEVCGNLVELIRDGGGELICCNEPMKKLVANTEDASQEKHVPVAVREDGKIVVSVGSEPHPMIPAHFIEWIAVVNDDGIERMPLKPGDEPKAVFRDRADADVYAYCNLHGLWTTSV